LLVVNEGLGKSDQVLMFSCWNYHFVNCTLCLSCVVAAYPASGGGGIGGFEMAWLTHHTHVAIHHLFLLKLFEILRLDLMF